MWAGFMVANLSWFTRQAAASVGHLEGVMCGGGKEGKERSEVEGRGEEG